MSPQASGFSSVGLQNNYSCDSSPYVEDEKAERVRGGHGKSQVPQHYMKAWTTLECLYCLSLAVTQPPASTVQCKLPAAGKVHCSMHIDVQQQTRL